VRGRKNGEGIPGAEKPVTAHTLTARLLTLSSFDNCATPAGAASSTAQACPHIWLQRNAALAEVSQHPVSVCPIGSPARHLTSRKIVVEISRRDQRAARFPFDREPVTTLRVVRYGQKKISDGKLGSVRRKTAKGKLSGKRSRQERIGPASWRKFRRNIASPWHTGTPRNGTDVLKM